MPQQEDRTRSYEEKMAEKMIGLMTIGTQSTLRHHMSVIWIDGRIVAEHMGRGILNLCTGTKKVAMGPSFFTHSQAGGFWDRGVAQPVTQPVESADAKS
jgi:hypothetical protein